MNTYPEAYILGVPAGAVHAVSQALLPHGPVKQLQGRYKGETEDSILIVPLDPRDFRNNILTSLLPQFGQETALYLDANREAYLVYTSGEERRVGPWRAVSPAVARSSLSYTYDPLTDQHYLATSCTCIYPSECPRAGLCAHLGLRSKPIIPEGEAL